ncbi:MAG: arylesterase [Pseudomonadota bacterium]
MRIKIKLILCVILLWSVLPAWSAERSILVLGDSLSAAYGIDTDAGWVNLLQQRLSERQPAWRVINGSITGDTTAGGLSRLPPLLEQHQPEIVIIELGSNDGLRGLSFRQLRKNQLEMIDAVEESGGQVLLIGGRLPPNYGAAYIEAFHQLFRGVAEVRSLPLVPFLLEGVAQDRNLMQADGYHPAEVAQPRLLENVWLVLEALL